MTRPIYGTRLLKTAQALGGIAAGRGRPALSDLRRATSTAYYAVFHQFIRHGAYDFLPEANEDEAAHISRWYTHTGVLRASELVALAGTPTELARIKRGSRSGVIALRAAGGGSVPLSVLKIADAFRTLQEARHSADYDGNYDPVRSVTIGHITDAEQALGTMRYLWRSGSVQAPDRLREHAGYRTFLRLALLKSAGPQDR